MDHYEIAADMIIQPGDMDKLPGVDMSPKIDIYESFKKAKNRLFNEYSLLDKSRFFDVIAQSNAKFWQSIGEQPPIQLGAKLPQNVVAQVTLERIYKEPSIVQFIKLIEKLRKHIAYASSILSIHGEEDVNEAKLPDAIFGEVMEAFRNFNLDDLIQLDNSKNMTSGLIEDEDVKRASRILSNHFHSEILAQHNDIIVQHKKSKLKWRHTKISAKLKFPIIDIVSEWEKK